MIAGEGLAGVVLAGLVWGGFKRAKEPLIGGPLGIAIGVVVVLAVCFLLYRAGRDIAPEGSDEVHASTSAK
jgi:hypothetical protein